MINIIIISYKSKKIAEALAYNNHILQVDKSDISENIISLLYPLYSYSNKVMLIFKLDLSDNDWITIKSFITVLEAKLLILEMSK